MFKNRVRTAALAGAVAIATGLSGFSVPAFAQDTTLLDGYNAADGSAAAPVVAENITEDELKAKTDATAEYLEPLHDPELGFGKMVKGFVLPITPGTDGFDPSEEAAQLAFAAARDEVARQLNIAAGNIQDARNSVAYALEKDQIATADWEALVDALNAYRGVINPLIEATNDAKTYEGREFKRIPSIPAATMENAVDVRKAILSNIELVNKQYETAGDWSIDQSRKKFVNRDHMKALEALKNAQDAGYPAVQAAYEKAIASNIEAQKSDVLVRQLYLERATAQRDTLRLLEGFFSARARYIELFQQGVLNGDKLLATEYHEVLPLLWEGLEYNLEHLNKADDAVEEFHEGWPKDKATNDESEAYYKAKANFAKETYKKIFKNGDKWLEALQRVQAIDARLVAERQAELDRLEAERIAAEKAEADRQALLAILAKLSEKDEAPAPAPGKASSFKLSS
ncbi:MAG TPA: S-layer protein PS2 [Corynebacterium sp.]|nr:S-layer protein PS2 [Corynebacterium sp.]